MTGARRCRSSRRRTTMPCLWTVKCRSWMVWRRRGSCAACMQAGMDDYLTKPFTREALHATLARWLLAAPTAAAPRTTANAPEPAVDPAAELLLDRATLAALRA